jgi:hypothetical protein
MSNTSHEAVPGQMRRCVVRRCAGCTRAAFSRVESVWLCRVASFGEVSSLYVRRDVRYDVPTVRISFTYSVELFQSQPRDIFGWFYFPLALWLGRS